VPPSPKILTTMAIIPTCIPICIRIRRPWFTSSHLDLAVLLRDDR
jgi:hypothetical protein